MISALSAAMRDEQGAIFDAMAQSVADVYSTEEINAQIEFFKTEIGQSIAAKQPEMTQTVSESMMLSSMNIAQNFIARMQEK